MHHRIRIFLAVFFLSFVAGCGTTHHFLPPQPIESGKWELQFTWHADLNNLYSNKFSLIFPEVNAYYGLGRNWNIGTGGYVFWPLSHLTISKYFRQGDNDYISVYEHARPIALTNNPQFEFGTIYNEIGNEQSTQYGFGLGFLQAEAWKIRVREPATETGPYPVLKVVHRRHQIGFSWAHYIGRTKSAVASSIGGPMDTLLNVPPSAVFGIITDTTYRECVNFDLFFSDGSFKRFERWCGYPDVFYDGPLKFADWMDNEIEIYLVDSSGLEHSLPVFINLDSLQEQLARGERIVIPRVSPVVLERVRRINSIVSDNSFGFGVFAEP